MERSVEKTINTIKYLLKQRLRTLSMEIPLQRLKYEEGEYILYRECTTTKKEYAVPIIPDQVGRWIAGELIQKAMPQMNDSQREFLITNLTPDEWNEMMTTDGFEDIDKDMSDPFDIPF